MTTKVTTTNLDPNLNPNQAPSEQNNHRRPKVAVIGCGPGGISFLHAVETRRQKCIQENDVVGLSKLPLVTVFERNHLPGGVWRSNSSSNSSSSSEAVTNGNNDNTQLVMGSVGGKKEKKYDDDDLNDDLTQTLTSDKSDTESGESELEQSFKSSDDNSTKEEEDEEDESSQSSESSAESEEEDDDYIVEGRTSSTTTMYEALWTNGPCQGIEFSDYTFQDHFQNKSLPVFLPRSAVLEYILARVTRKCPDFFKKDHVRFHTNVECINYNDENDKFVITSYDTTDPTQQRTVEEFDTCIWAAGENGCAKIPKSIRTTLHNGNYQGLDVHSSQAANHLLSLRDKNIVMIGDGLSAEDLALQAIKLGIGKIYIISRSGNGTCSYTSAWPEDKVEIIHDHVITKVIEDGNGLRLCEMEYNVLTGKITKVYDDEDKDNVRDLHDISAVIYCTGYEPNTDMIGPTIDSDDCEEEYINDLPNGWKMEPNDLTEVFGDVEPSDVFITDNEYLPIEDAYYKGISIDNPKMMYLFEETANFPLQEIDVKAWYFLAIIMGDITLPSETEMKRLKQKMIHEGMQIPFIRYETDMAYRKAFEDALENGMSWLDDATDERMQKLSLEASAFALKQFGENMKAASYPLQLLGPDGELNEKGNLLLQMTFKSGLERSFQVRNSRKTFRDIDPSSFRSLHTGQEAVNLKSLWLDIDDNDPNLIGEN